MKNPLQPRNWLSGMRLPSASAALALAAVLVSTVITTSVAQAQTLKILHSFDGADGAGPSGAPLVQATNGDLYGTTGGGGSHEGHGHGTVFKITPSGTLTTLHIFFTPADGVSPVGLVQHTNRHLYGTTSEGGTSIGNGQCGGGCGVVFDLTPSGKLTTLYNFCLDPADGCPDGAIPLAALVQATDGNLYGTNASEGGFQDGTIFQITPSGTLTTLHSFWFENGLSPSGALVQATNGDLYGVTVSGGQGRDGEGTVYKMTLSGTQTSLYSFCHENPCLDGAFPEAALVQATNGDLYGTTVGGGANGDGTVFEMTLRGKLTSLYSFCSQSNCTDGANPYTGLVQATDGNLYGTTSAGGANTTACGDAGCGTIYKITPNGALTTVYSFCSLANCADGTGPAGLVQDTNGDLYGTTGGGGANGDGTVFSLSVGLGPFVETRLTSGKVGAAVLILGTKLTGATSVKFNGKTAVFKVVSSSEITTTVPEGATTGKVEVKTPSGTLISNVAFRVTK